LVLFALTFVGYIISAFTITRNKKDCDDAKSYADDAYSYFRKAYFANSIENAQYYAKKAMNSASEITDEAEDCEND
jgi:ABC-type transporter lipoprotein component MlaA